MFVIEFPEHYTLAMRLGVLFLLFLVQLLGYLIWFGGIKMKHKKRILRRQKEAGNDDSVSGAENSGAHIMAVEDESSSG